MAEHGNKFYLVLPKKIFTDGYKSLSADARRFYAVLNEPEHRFAGRTADGPFPERQRLGDGRWDKTGIEAKKQPISSLLIVAVLSFIWPVYYRKYIIG